MEQQILHTAVKKDPITLPAYLFWCSYFSLFQELISTTYRILRCTSFYNISYFEFSPCSTIDLLKQRSIGVISQN